MTAKRNAPTKRRKRFLRTRRLLRRPSRIPAQFRPRRHIAARPATNGV
jgi:hypothetical protein